MWILKLKIKHDCTIGNRCEKYGVISYSLSIGNWSEKGNNYTSERHTLEGDVKNIKKFLMELRKDKRITKLEVDKNTLFFIGKQKGKKIPTSFYNPKMFFVKPVYVDKEGYEYWEMGSYDKLVLSRFLESLEKQKYKHLEVLQFKNVKLNNIYFPAIAPSLTEKQKRVFETAVEYGYYDIPKRTDLKRLAKIMKISLATYQEHLKRAEAKIIPKLKVG